MGDIRENAMQQGTADYLRGIASNGNSILVPASNFVRKSDGVQQLLNGTLYKIADVASWDRFAALCVIGISGADNHVILSITGTFASGISPIICAKYIGSYAPSDFKILYKIDNKKLGVYIYSESGTGNILPFVIHSSCPLAVSSVSDISGYTEVEMSKMTM